MFPLMTTCDRCGTVHKMDGKCLAKPESVGTEAMPIDLDEAERIGKAAGTSPWDCDQDLHANPSETWFVVNAHATIPNAVNVIFECDSEADARFAVYARNHWQEMVDEMRELRRRLES